MADIPFGAFVFPGWVPALGLEKYVQESTIAMTVVGFLFLWPARATKSNIVGWAEVERIPIGVIFLFGGGFALAAGLESSGLSAWIAGRLSGLEGQPLLLIVFGLCLFTTFFTELTSNTATTILMLSLLLPMTQTLQVHPLAIMLPVTITASYAFMLPVATPPNTIVFASGHLAVRDMVRVGFWLNLLGALAVVAATQVWGSRVFGF
jgi:sodium-dependent dicarboxylate transporter 2/3/5